MSQVIDFPTWSRIVNKVLKESTLDHAYLTNSTICSNVENYKPCFGDHLLIVLSVDVAKAKHCKTFKRDWRNYSKNDLLTRLNNVGWCMNIDNVQEFWNDIEMKIIFNFKGTFS